MISVSSSLNELRAEFTRDPQTANRRATHEFEAMVLNEMLKAGAKPLFKEGLLDGGSAGRMAREQLYAQLALEVTRAGGLGLAEEIETDRLPRAEPEEAKT